MGLLDVDGFKVAQGGAQTRAVGIDLRSISAVRSYNLTTVMLITS